MANNDKIESKDLMLIKRVAPQPAEEGQRYPKPGYSLRVVQWLYDGKGKNAGTVQGSASLEKRELFVDEEGEVKIGKAKGFTLLDMTEINTRMEEIMAMLKNPPAPAWASKPASNEIEEPTW